MLHHKQLFNIRNLEQLFSEAGQCLMCGRVFIVRLQRQLDYEPCTARKILFDVC
jgi:hypothetical protein